MENILQKSDRDINYVQGNQYIFNIDKAVFDMPKGDNLNIKIKEISYVDYWNIIQENVDLDKLVMRVSILEEIKAVLASSNSLLIHGEPGIGKTTLVSGINVTNRVIYISLKEKTIEDVFMYLINSYSISFESIDNMSFMLESLLKSSNNIFIFDDCESNKDVANKLEVLEKFENKFLYISRDKNILNGKNISKFEVNKMSKDEVKKYININLKDTYTDSIDELYVKSRGNPLYLHYYVNYKISPLPSGLENYQDALWNSLDIDQKEILTCISITNFPIHKDVLKSSVSKLMGKNLSPMEFQQKLSKIQYLLEVKVDVIKVFHPLFKEYIIDYLDQSCIKSDYETIVGRCAINGGYVIEGTLLLLDKNDDSINDNLLYVGVTLYQNSKILLSLKVLESALDIYKEKDGYLNQYAYTNYYISQIYMDINQIDKSMNCINKALEIYELIDDDSGCFSCLLFKAVFLAEQGKKLEVEKLLEEISNFEFEDGNLNGCKFINLSKINLQFNQYELAALNAKSAYEFFIEVNNTDGAVKSILNYSAALNNIDQEDLATEYLEKMLKSDDLKMNKIMKASIMNNLTSCYRKNKQYEKAIELCRETIQISKDLNQPYKVAMNMSNLGNIYRDLEQWDKCETIYNEAIDFADKNGITREVGRGNELLASTYYLQGKLQDCIVYSEKAIKASKLANDDFRVAESYIEMSKAYFDLELIIPYINSIEEAVTHYMKENFFDESLNYIFKLLDYYIKNNNDFKIKEHLSNINKIVDLSKNNIDYYNLFYNLTNDLKISTNNDVIDIYYNIIVMYIDSDMRINLMRLFIDFISVCKLKNNEYVKNLIVNIIKKLIKKGVKCRRALSILAFLIEQSGSLLNFNDIEFIIKDLRKYHENIFIRSVSKNTYIFTDYWKKDIYLQYMCDINQLTNLKVSLALYLIFKFNQEYIMKYIDNVKLKYIDFNILDYQTARGSLDKKIDGTIGSNISGFPFNILSGISNDIATFILLDDGYDLESDHSENKDNKIFIGLIMLVFIHSISRISNLSIEKADVLYSKNSREFIEYLTWVKPELEDSKWVIEKLPIM